MTKLTQEVVGRLFNEAHQQTDEAPFKVFTRSLNEQLGQQAAALGVEQMREALRRIAGQELSADMSVDDQLGGDFEGAYNAFIEVARAALVVAPPPMGRDALEEVAAAAINYIRCSTSPLLTPYIKENGRHGGSPWSELRDAVAALSSPPVGSGGEDGSLRADDGTAYPACAMKPWVERTLREWLVIENAKARAVFRDDNEPRVCGYIPRADAEQLLGRSMEGNVWFSPEESEKMKMHPNWRETEPPMPNEEEYL